ncbi:MAG: D-alanyl-D-alanine carboxypeptidase [Microvirga sp.]|jgi:D-alanyl-D-alanine carboxypeptidase (penicillin-binding protein 5/6)|nr:D-alanyl-D-alanine carboxypeptidase [Microvirga sp.]
MGWCSVQAFALAAAVALGIGAPQGASAQSFQTAAPHAILMDYDTGTVLFEKAADELTAPASMAKTMAVEVIFSEIAQGRLSLDSEFVISENAWRKGGGSSGGSAMFAKLNDRIKLSDLLRGIIVQSGNDASIAVAEGVAGTEENFARMMTKRAREIGMAKSSFRNATGFHHPDQKVTMRELAILAAHTIETYPELYKIYAEREFTWNKIRQQNRNPLLRLDVGADGLKTGYIEESGYGLLASAVQNGQRLILAVNGLKNAREREAEARKLLEWGFRAFEARLLFEKGEVIGEAKVFGGARNAVPLAAKRPVRLLFPRGTGERVSARIVYKGPIMPPVQQGAEVARLRVTRGDVQALDMPLYAAEEVGVGSIPQRAVDGLLEFGTGLVRKAFSRSTSGG